MKPKNNYHTFDEEQLSQLELDKIRRRAQLQIIDYPTFDPVMAHMIAFMDYLQANNFRIIKDSDDEER